MIANLEDFIYAFNEKTLKLKYKNMNSVIQEYTINIFTQNNCLNINYNQNFEESMEIMINSCNINSNPHFIIGFKQTIIVIDQSSLSLLQKLFSISTNKHLYFLSDIKSIFDKFISVDYQYFFSDSKFDEEISSFNDHLIISQPKIATEIKEILTFIQSCISGYLIKQSYSKLNKNRLDDTFWFLNKDNRMKIWEENEFICLRTLGLGSSFIANLIYHIKEEEIFVLKKPRIKTDENQKLIERELENYSVLYHPFLPKIYGKINQLNYVVIEFINGTNLLKMKSIDIDVSIRFIFELIVVVKDLHEKGKILRDLKPSNIMIDQNNDVVVIDFDRMVNQSEKRVNYTNDLVSEYIAPEVENGEYSDKSDIYSLGQIMKFLKDKIIFDDDLN